MLEQFTKIYSIPKTLRFSLIPVEKTEENFHKAHLLEDDKIRAKNYENAKKIIDKYHQQFIDSVLSGLFIDGVNDYAELYYKASKAEKELAAMKKAEADMRKAISKALTKNENYNSLFSKDLIENILPAYLTDEEEKEAINSFHGFTTYFSGFNKNRMNMYSDEEKSTAIAYRCINDNLPKFLDNCASFKKVKSALPKEKTEELNKAFFELYNIYAEDIFSVDYFSFVLSQRGINIYNEIIGGIKNDAAGLEIIGLNQYINLYNQQVAKGDKSKRLPFMKVLFKQILSDRQSVSFIPEKFNSDKELLDTVNLAYNGKEEKDGIAYVISEINKLFSGLSEFNKNGIFISAKGSNITDISNSVYGSWSVIPDGWIENYTKNNPPKKGIITEKYIENRQKEYKKISSFSLAEIEKYGENAAEPKYKDTVEYFKTNVESSAALISESCANAAELLSGSRKTDKKLCADVEATELIKNLLDSVKALEALIKPLCGSGKEENKDEVFYGIFTPLFEQLAVFDKLYDKVRNYLTQKPYSEDKIKLNFENPQFLGGWDKNKERDYRTVLLRKNGIYYLAIMDKSNSKLFMNIPKINNENSYEKMEYKLLPGPNKMLPKVFFAASNAELFKPSNEILEIRKKESFKKGDTFNLDDCRKLIDYYKESINKHPDWSNFGFTFSDTQSYKDISEFYKEISNQGYKISFTQVPESFINQNIESGKLYLFKTHNKDFSEYSKGKPNLHTLYFRMLFDERNLSDVVFKLNGESEMFYRESSIKDSEKTIHPANEPIKNKNPENKKAESIFSYDLIKDRRYTTRQFSIHIPITINYKSDGNTSINEKVRQAIKENDNLHIIGIDRGERNLLDISVINSKGEIVEQSSLNIIESDKGYKVDYQELLGRKESERDKARKNWTSVENIKELKEGYLSQAVHKICELVVKYDAVIAMENLNFGFKKGRFKFEKQVYQKFENMLISKLNYLVTDKSGSPDAPGGILNAYQLTNMFDGVNRSSQNGIIFYVPAWCTSKIDPVTGFVDLLRPKYKSVDDSVKFFEKFKNICFDKNEDMFRFDFDYSDFDGGITSFRKEWSVYTNGERIETFRNSEINNEWDNRTVLLTSRFKEIFEEHKIDYSKNLKQQILSQSSKEFFEKLTKALALTLQLRNSITGKTDIDYIISPVKDSSGAFYDSRNYRGSKAELPVDADANGAYNIARKALMASKILKETDYSELSAKGTNEKMKVTNAQWLEYAQKQ